MSPEHDTDPTAAPPTSGNTTDPTFPPKIGRQGPKAVHVTAVQGPGVESHPKEGTTTERLLTGLLDGQKPQDKPRKKDSSGDDAAAYSASPRPAPVARTDEDEEPAVIVAPTPLHRSKDDAESGVPRSVRDEATVELPRTRRHWLMPLVAAALGGLVMLLVYFVLRAPARPSPPALPRVTTPVARTTIPPPESVPAPPPTDTLPDPVIESQKLQKPPRVTFPAPRPPPNTALPPASVTVAPPPSASPPATAAPTSPAAPDFDELKKGIKH